MLNAVDNAAAILESAAFVLSVPDWHTKKQFARTRAHSGLVVNPIDPSADCFCAAGALMAASAELGSAGLDLAMEELISTIVARMYTNDPEAAIATWNDLPETEPEDVVEALLETAQRVRTYA